MTTALAIFETSENFYKEKIQRYISNNDYINAHLYQGFLFGIQAYYHNSYNKPYSTHMPLDWARWNRDGALYQCKYGDVAWWNKYIQGYESMQETLKKEIK